jgi:hypothetical protein
MYSQTQPEVMRDKLEKFLGDNAISYSYSKTSKFGGCSLTLGLGCVHLACVLPSVNWPA